MDTKIGILFSFMFFFSGSILADEALGSQNYTNFGMDLDAPIFPVNGVLNIYQNKGDTSPIATLKDKPVINQRGAVKPCIKNSADGWAQCKVSGVRGWVKHDDFRSAEEYMPVPTWAFRYWLYIRSPGTGSEDAVILRESVNKNPYLIAPAAYSNIFFHVLFDKEGRAISPKSHKPTGDRVFISGNAVFLAPGDPKRRRNATWLFLNFYNEKLNALCPGQNADSCMSAVNTSPGWPGIKRMYEEPSDQYKQKNDDQAWFGNGEVAFARHIDPVKPLMYRVPDNVVMSADKSEMTLEQVAKNREKLVCIADCERH
ncbi:hypothetical protein ACL58G_17220 [Massilia sp. GER05]|uniref:hypothetical protein n=1 Tax=unclassified Massilia TaxID=2609279 RepID=UPI0039B0F860